LEWTLRCRESGGEEFLEAVYRIIADVIEDVAEWRRGSDTAVSIGEWGLGASTTTRARNEGKQQVLSVTRAENYQTTRRII
jgi:hypothetical protein